MESAAKIRAAVRARQDPNLIIVARTDALTEADAIERAKIYVEAGADLIQPISRCFTSIDGLRRLRQACGVPLSLQLLGWLENDLTTEQIQEVAGLAVYPLVGLFTVTETLKQNYAQLWKSKSVHGLPQPMINMADFKKMIGFSEVEALQSMFLLGNLPKK
jgi:methylisocitrate lyase